MQLIVLCFDKKTTFTDTDYIPSLLQIISHISHTNIYLYGIED